MKNLSLTLYLEVNNTNYIFFVVESDEQKNTKIVYNNDISLNELGNDRTFNLEKTFNIIKENIYLVEQKLNCTFKEIVLILDNFSPSFINVTGFKKLNGSQVLRENITYILNTLKSCVDEIESKKTVLHIFNSKFYLDNKKIENLPVGLFGDLYSHELSFTLINSNVYNNFIQIFEKCNLKVKKILIKSFVKGANLSEKNKNIDTFFLIKFNKNNSKIFYFENNSLKFEEKFNFGIDIILRDISKITSLDKDVVKTILYKAELHNELLEDNILEKEFFTSIGYKKIKKKLIYEIALARIREISEIILFKNINLSYYKNFSKVIFLEIDKDLRLRNLDGIFKIIFSKNNAFDVNFAYDLSINNLSKTADKLVHFGWEKEAIPITQSKKTLIARFFDKIFN